MVEDRRFTIPIVVDSWEETCPILVGEVSDRRLGLETAEVQDRFIKLSGFRRVLAAEGQPESSVRRSRSPPGFRLVLDDFPRLASTVFPPSVDSALSPLEPGLTPSPTCCAIPSTTGSSASSGSVRPKTSPIPQVCHSASPPLASAQLATAGDPPTPQSGLEPSPCAGICLAPPPLELDLRLMDGALGPLVDHPVSGKSVAFRRSVRLAAKCRGSKKSSLSRAQDLMCRKLKMVRFSARASHSSSNSASSSCSLSAPRTREQPEILDPSSRSTFDAGPPGPSGGPDASLPRPDLLTPLTSVEVREIKLACGIIDAGLGISPPNGGLAGEV